MHSFFSLIETLICQGIDKALLATFVQQNNLRVLLKNVAFLKNLFKVSFYDGKSKQALLLKRSLLKTLRFGTGDTDVF